MMDSKQTPQQRIEQDGKVYEWTKERRRPKCGEYYLGESAFEGLVKLSDHDFTHQVRDIYREAPAELAQASEEARPTAEQVVSGEEVVKASESSNSVDVDAVIAICREAADGYKRGEEQEIKRGSDVEALKWRHCASVCKLIETRVRRLSKETHASRDEELRRLREELQTQRAMTDSFCKRATELASEKANVLCDAQRLIDWINSGAKSASTAFTEGPDRNVAYAIESQLAAANEQVEKLKGELESKQRLMDVYVTMSREANDFYGRLHQAYRKGESNDEVTRLVRLLVEGWRTAESAVPNYAQLEAEVEALNGDLSHCEQLCGEACRALAQFRPQLSQQIIVRCKRAASGHITVPLTHSEAEKICAGEPVRTTKDFGAVVAAKLESDPQLKASVECEGEVMLLQAENEKLKEQRDLAYNWLPRRDKEMFDQKYPKEVTV